MALPEVGVQAVVKDFNQYLAQMKAMTAAGEKFSGSLEELAGGADDASKSLGNMADDVKETGKGAVDLAAKMDIVKNAFSAVQALAEQGLELARLGAQAEAVEQRFAAFAEAAGGAEVILQAFQEGAGGTVSKMEAMQSATRLLQMGLVGSADEMSQVVELATRLGDQTASAGDRVGDFALLLANQSIPRLDNFGISSGRVRARIEELQNQMPGLARETAFMQAVMEEGTKSLEVLGPRTNDAATQLAQLEAQAEDAKIALAQALLPALMAVVQITMDLVGVAGDAVTGLYDLVGSIGAVQTAANLLAGPDGFGGVATSFVLVAESAAGTQGAVEGVTGVLVEAVTASQAMADETRFLIDTYSEAKFVTDDLTIAHADLGNTMGVAVTGFDDAAYSAAEAALAEREAAQSAEELGRAHDAAKDKVSGAAGIIIGATRDYVAAEKDAEQATKDLAAAQEISRQAARDAAIAYADLAQSLKDATAADVAKVALDRLGKSLEDGIITEGQYKEASRELMLQFGLATEESLALAEGVDIIGDAVDDGSLSTRDYTEAVGTLVDAAKDGEVSQEELLSEYERTPAVFGDAEEAMGRAEEMMEDNLPESADKFIASFGDAEESLGRVEDKLGDAIPASAEESRAAIEEVTEAEAIAAGATRDLEEALGEAAGELDNVSEKASGSGAAVGSNFADGIFQSIPDVIAATQAMAQGAADNLPSSEPKDPSSPFRNLAARGAAVVENFSAGILSAIPTAVAAIQQMGLDVVGSLGGGALPGDFDALLDIGKGFAGLGGVAGKIFKREEINPLSERAKGLEGRLKDVRKVYDDIQKDMDKLTKKLRDQTLTEKERRDIEYEIALLRGQQLAPAERMRDISKELLGVNEELAKKQELLDRMQAEQETADFLKQQRDLLEMITKNGLNARKILQDIELGADADPAAVIKAMTDAMKAVNKELNEQIVNRDELIARMEEEQALAEAQAALAEAQQRQKFLQDQIGLLQMIEDEGLDADAILQGFEVGADASLLDFTEAMRRAIEAMIAQTEDELEIGSPSRVFADIGANIMQGLAMGISSTAGLPAAQTMAATQTAMMAPSFAMPSMAGGPVTNIDAPVSINATINTPTDETRFFQRVTNVVAAGFRGRA